MNGIKPLDNVNNINNTSSIYNKPIAKTGLMENKNLEFKNELVKHVGLNQFYNNSSDELDNSLKFTKHALERISSRGINLSNVDLNSLSKAVHKADNKGIKDSVVFLNDAAFIISIRNKTVITAIDKESFKEKVITNVDGVIIL